ncbi:host attachment protein [Novosphingobium sp. FKTRR1]|uniref:baeRF12 domain-containing protein n=1 Tax=Novosphingobium sp. FKTRR1 TaxID=2879118 RepID=UPI001CF0B18F|nr:host attachment protein [Novosphingobium sp. FKTRR1]
MLLPHAAVVVIVDGHGWSLLRNGGNETEPELHALPLPELVEHNHGSGGRHGSSSGGTSAHQMREDAHAAAVADWLNRQVAGHKLEHIVVIATPRTLGELRRHYTPAVERALVGELAKNLLGRQPHEVLQALRAPLQ